MCFLWLNYEIYATICPLDYSLVSFLNCVNYSVGIFISYLMFFILEMLANYGWNSVLCLLSLDYGLYVMHLSHSNAHDLVFALVLWMFSLLSSNCSTKTLENPILLYCDYWDCVGLFFCSLRTNFGTNIFGTIVGD